MSAPDVEVRGGTGTADAKSMAAVSDPLKDDGAAGDGSGAADADAQEPTVAAPDVGDADASPPAPSPGDTGAHDDQPATDDDVAVPERAPQADLVADRPLGPADARDDAEPEVDVARVRALGALRLGGFDLGPRRSAWDRVRVVVATGAAVIAHLVVAALIVSVFQASRLGADGANTQTIGVEIVSAAALARATGEAVGVGAGDDQAAESDESADLAERRRSEAQTRPTSPTQPQRPLDNARNAQPRPDVVARQPPPANPVAGIVVAPRADATPPRRVQAAPRPARAAPVAPASQQSSAPSIASQAADAGRSADPNATAAPAITGTARAAGRIARGYDATVVRALGALKAHLVRAKAGRSGAANGNDPQGDVELELTIGLEGRPENIQVTRSSGVPGLDQLAVADIRSFRFPPPPQVLPADRRTYRLPITYR